MATHHEAVSMSPLLTTLLTTRPSAKRRTTMDQTPRCPRPPARRPARSLAGPPARRHGGPPMTFGCPQPRERRSLLAQMWGKEAICSIQKSDIQAALGGPSVLVVDRPQTWYALRSRASCALLVAATPQIAGRRECCHGRRRFFSRPPSPRRTRNRRS